MTILCDIHFAMLFISFVRDMMLFARSASFCHGSHFRYDVHHAAADNTSNHKNNERVLNLRPFFAFG
jgi:hypothetical protein